jgi:diacylglycerol kinase family enzyme
MVKVFQTRKVEVTATERTPAEVDGELLGQLPARFSLEPLGLRVVVPQEGQK